MRTDRFLLSIVLGVSAAAYADSQEPVRIIPNPPHMGAAIYEIRVAPSAPSTLDEIAITVCGWKPAGNYQVYDTDVRTEGADIWVDLYWNAPGEGTCAFAPYEHTVPLGTLSAGIYVVHVTLRSAMSGSLTTTFTVCDAPANVDPGPGDSDPAPVGGLDLSEWLAEHGFSIPEIPEPGFSLPALPGFEIQHVPFSDVSSIKEGISQLRIDPAFPRPSDEVSVTISGWKPSADLDVERTTLRTEGNEIWLDLYWHTRPLMPVAHASDGVMCVQSVTPVTVIQYDITPYNGTPFGYTAPLGTFSPGTYVLHVTNHSPMSGSASTSFTVSSTDSDKQPPWWVTLLGTR